jgi:hypothetical protein
MSDLSLAILVAVLVALMVVTLVRQRQARAFTGEQKLEIMETLRPARTAMLVILTAAMIAVAVAFSRRAYDLALQLEAVCFVIMAATTTFMFFRIRRLALPAAYIALWGAAAAILSLGLAGFWLSLRYAG